MKIPYTLVLTLYCKEKYTKEFINFKDKFDIFVRKSKFAPFFIIRRVNYVQGFLNID